jgi:hypothetical protein
MKAERGLASKHGAGGAQELECELIVKVGGCFVCYVVEGTQKGVGCDVWNRMGHTLYAATESGAGAEEWVSCSALCPGVHSVPVLLVAPGDGHKFDSL